jgi:hypothetical protein
MTTPSIVLHHLYLIHYVAYSHHGSRIYGPSYLGPNESENKMGVIGEWVSKVGGVTSKKTTKSIGFFKP